MMEKNREWAVRQNAICSDIFEIFQYEIMDRLVIPIMVRNVSPVTVAYHCSQGSYPCSS